jgi:hypothetical protein
MRFYGMTTITLPSDYIETFTLERRGAAATLTIQQDQKPAERYTGRVEETGGTLTIHLKYPSGASVPWVRCTPNTLRVSVATAKVVVYGRMCPDEHGWEPEDEARVSVLDCKLLDKDAPEPADYRWKTGRNLVFAPAPGIEWVHVEDECLKTDGWREIPADNSVVPPRGPYP